MGQADFPASILEPVAEAAWRERLAISNDEECEVLTGTDIDRLSQDRKDLHLQGHRFGVAAPVLRAAEPRALKRLTAERDEAGPASACEEQEAEREVGFAPGRVSRHFGGYLTLDTYSVAPPAVGR